MPDYLATMRAGIAGMRIGVVTEFSGIEGTESGVEAACQAAYEQFAALGAELVPVSLAYAKYALPTYYITAPAEASANLARFDGVKYGLSVEADTLLDAYLRTRGEAAGPTTSTPVNSIACVMRVW